MAALLIAVFAFPVQPGAASDDLGLFSDSEDQLFEEGSLFGEGGLVSEVAEDQELEESLEEVFLTSEGVTLGGQYRFSLTTSWTWNDPEALRDSPTAPDRETLGTSLGSTLYLDARPEKNYRVYVKAQVTYPFTTLDAEQKQPDEDTPAGSGRRFEDVIRITEMFSDFTLGDRLFLRVGKQQAKWGTGYFFSPADVINLSPIKPEDPEADREGPLSIKANLPLAAHNLYLYLIAEGADSPSEIGIAPKAEFVLGGTELGLGGYYRQGSAPAAIGTVSTSIGFVSLFGEGIIKKGSDKTFVRSLGSEAVETYTDDQSLFPSVTVGAQVGHSDEEQRYSLSFACQYLYNGEGYDDPSLLLRSVAAADVGLTPCDLRLPGKHYAASTLSCGDILKSDISLSLFWMGNLSDGSGRASGSLSWSPAERVTGTFGVSYSYGDSPTEFAPLGNPVSVFAEVSIGGGRF